MARPTKNNADYFPHDAHMRNDPRILALRRKHGLTGYAVYVMTIEAMSNANYFKLDVSAIGREIISGDFGVDESTLDNILQYCVQIDLFQLSNDVLTCNSLNKRFESLISRRVSDTETEQKPAEIKQEPYSKVKESKVKESKEEERIASLGFDKTIELLKKDEQWVEQIQMHHKGKDLWGAAGPAWMHLQGKPTRFSSATINDFKSLLNTWLENQKVTGQTKKLSFELKDLKNL